MFMLMSRLSSPAHKLMLVLMLASLVRTRLLFRAQIRNVVMDGECASEDTPKKFQTNTGCVFCGCELPDSRKKTRLNGKVSDLRNRICNIMDVPLSSVNMDSYHLQRALLSRC